MEVSGPQSVARASGRRGRWAAGCRKKNINSRMPWWLWRSLLFGSGSLLLTVSWSSKLQYFALPISVVTLGEGPEKLKAAKRSSQKPDPCVVDARTTGARTECAAAAMDPTEVSRSCARLRIASAAAAGGDSRTRRWAWKVVSVMVNVALLSFRKLT